MNRTDVKLQPVEFWDNDIENMVAKPIKCLVCGNDEFSVDIVNSTYPVKFYDSDVDETKQIQIGEADKWYNKTSLYAHVCTRCDFVMMFTHDRSL